MKILFVCLGNICRSPTAEIVFREIVAREAPDLPIEIDSAGNVTMRTKGVKGPVCMAYADLLARIVGREESREKTHEFYEAEQHVHRQLEIKQHRG